MVKINFFGDFFAYHPQNIKLDNTLEDSIKESNLSVCNFEGPIKITGKALPKSGPNISQPIESATILKNLGFNVFSLGNNHAMDFGSDDLLQTIGILGENNIVGAGTTEKAYQAIIKRINNISIGFIAASHNEFGMCYSNRESKGVAWINDPQIDQLIIQYRSIVDFIFILPHAGIENIDIPLPLWRERYKTFIDLGVDAVIASHPHVPQGKEIYKGKTIYYSLGNFFFERMNGKDPRHRYSIMVQATIDDSGTLSVSDRVIKREDFSLTTLTQKDSEQYLQPLNDCLSNEHAYSNRLKYIIDDLWKNVYKKQIKYSLRKIDLSYGIIHNLKMIIKGLLHKKDNLLLLN